LLYKSGALFLGGLVWFGFFFSVFWLFGILHGHGHCNQRRRASGVALIWSLSFI
jgi:hypothetical protein